MLVQIFLDSATKELLKPSIKQTLHGADVGKEGNQYIVKPFPPSPGVSDKSGKNPIHLVCDNGNKARLLQNTFSHRYSFLFNLY